MRRRVKALGWPGGPAQVERQPLTPRVAAWVRFRPEPVGACALDCAESKIPARWSRRSRNSFSTLRHLSRRCWRGDCSTFDRLDWLAEPLGQARLGVDLYGCPPLADNLREIRVRVHLRGSNQRPRELVKERAPILRRQELRPRERIQNRTVEDPGSVHGQVPERQGEHAEHIGTFRVTVGKRECKDSAPRRSKTCVGCDTCEVTEQIKRAGVPTGTVTFLFTDVEGSTRLWQGHPGAMAAALARHDEIIRAAVTAHGGYVFSTAGDAFAASFARPGDAIDAAVDVQQGLAAETWPPDVSILVRVGIHTGEAVERGGDYFGPTLNLGARIMSAGHGGQVLMSATTASLTAPSRHVLTDLGEHDLRDIDGTQRVFQVVGENMRADFPPIRSLNRTKHRLPSQRSSFVGRELEVAKTRSLLATSRLVTLTGSGGCGKTRVAIEAAAAEVDAFRDGVFFVDLARTGDGSGVAESFALALDFAPNGERPLPAQVIGRIASKSVLLIVDNCEHVLDEVGELLDDLLTSCANTRVLATSREAIELDGEQTFRLPSLNVDTGSTDDARPPSVRLFLERAAESGAEVAASDDDVIAEICRRLDGLPLAIELAAARTGVLSPSQILERLDDRFTLLTGGRRRTRGRQQTLETAIDWSYDLLGPVEQDALRRLSVMPAAFDLDLATAVVATTPAEALNIVSSLVSRSLLQTVRDDASGAVRYRLLETIRVYGYQRLLDAGDAEATRHRHAEHIAVRLDALADVPVDLVPDLVLLADDVLSAIDWCRSRSQTNTGARIVAVAAPIFVARGMKDRGRELCEWAETVDDQVLRSKVLIALAFLAIAFQYRDRPAHRIARDSLASAGDVTVGWRMRAHWYRAATYFLFDLDRCEAEIERAYQLTGCPEDAIGLAFINAALKQFRGDHHGASQMLKDLPTPDAIAGMMSGAAHASLLLALSLAEEREEVRRTLDAAAGARDGWRNRARRGDQWTLSYEIGRVVALGYLGEIDQARRDLADAASLLGGDRLPGLDGDLLVAAAMLCLYDNDPERASVLLGAVNNLRSHFGICLYMEVHERIHVRPEGDLAKARMAVMHQRLDQHDLVRTRAARAMLDEEIGRLTALT